MKLENPIDYGYDASPICLPTQGTQYSFGTKGIVIGTN
jgi:hypothetical protein